MSHGRATAESARALLVSLGIWDEHENLDFIRLRTPTAFSAEVRMGGVDDKGAVD